MCEVGRRRQIAEGGDAVALGRLREGGHWQPCRDESAGRQAENLAAADHPVRTPAAAWPPFSRSTTRSWEIPTAHISAAGLVARSDPNAPCAPRWMSIAARRRNSTAARGRAREWRRPAPRGPSGRGRNESFPPP